MTSQNLAAVSVFIQAHDWAGADEIPGATTIGFVTKPPRVEDYVRNRLDASLPL